MSGHYKNSKHKKLRVITALFVAAVFLMICGGCLSSVLG